MTPVQTIFTTKHDVIADIVQVLILSLAGLDVKPFKSDVVARLGTGAVEPNKTVV